MSSVLFQVWESYGWGEGQVWQAGGGEGAGQEGIVWGEGACWARNRGFTELRVLNNLFSLLRSMKSLYKSLLGP